MKDLTGTRFYRGGFKHFVVKDDGRTVLIQAAYRTERGHDDYGRRWVSRDVVLPPVKPAPYFWLGAEAEAVGALKEMG